MKALQKLLLTFLAAMLLFGEFIQPFAMASKKKHKDSCSQDDDCESGYCNQRKECDCGPLPDRHGRTMEEQFYDEDLQMCLSRVGQLCTIHVANDRLAPFICIPNAVCISSKYQTQSRQFFGTCSCDRGYQPTSDERRCISNAEIRTAKITSSNQVRSQESSGRSSSHSISTNTFTLMYSTTGLILLFCLFPFR